MSTEVFSTIKRNISSFKPDYAWIALAAILAVLAIANQAQFAESVKFTLIQFGLVLPFLALAVGLAAYAKASHADRIIARAFSGHVVLMIVMAALLGGLSPFCSCGVIPLIAALLSMGVPLPAVMAFWLSSPLMDPSMFALTLGTLGMTFAVAKTAAAIGVGLFGGFTLLVLKDLPVFANALRPEVGDGGCGASAVRSTQPIIWKFWQQDERSHVFIKELKNTFLFLGKWLTLAFLLESLMLAYIPGEVIAASLGGSGLGGITLAALIGVPAYLNGYAALPLVSGLVANGMDPGAAMAFLIAGGVSSIPAAIAVFALVRMPVFASYLLLAFTGAIISGLLFTLIA